MFSKIREKLDDVPRSQSSKGEFNKTAVTPRLKIHPFATAKNSQQLQLFDDDPASWRDSNDLARDARGSKQDLR